jgi:hypothetical protein
LTDKAISVTNSAFASQTTNYVAASHADIVPWFTALKPGGNIIDSVPNLNNTNAGVLTNVSAKGTPIAGITSSYGSIFLNPPVDTRPQPVNTNPDIGCYEFAPQPEILTSPTITTQIGSFPTPIVGAAFGGAGGFMINATGSGTFTWTISSGALPSGLGFTDGGQEGVISGTPLVTSPANGNVTFRCSNGVTPDATLTWNWAVTGTGVAPTITTPTTIPTPAAVGQNFTYTLSATGTAPITWSATVVPSDAPVLVSAPTITVWRAAP